MTTFSKADDAVMEHFIQRMRAQFGQAKRDPGHDAQVVLNYCDVLRGFSSRVLEEAANRIIASRTQRGWPLPAEARSVCQAVHREFYPPQRKAEDLSFYEREAAAEKMMTTDLAKRAAKEGWVFALYQNVYNTGVQPKDIESFRTIEIQNRQRRIQKLGGVLDKATRSVYEASERRERDLRKRVLGEQAEENQGDTENARSNGNEEQAGTPAETGGSLPIGTTEVEAQQPAGQDVG